MGNKCSCINEKITGNKGIFTDLNQIHSILVNLEKKKTFMEELKKYNEDYNKIENPKIYLQNDMIKYKNILYSITQNTCNSKEELNRTQKNLENLQKNYNNFMNFQNHISHVNMSFESKYNDESKYKNAKKVGDFRRDYIDFRKDYEDFREHYYKFIKAIFNLRKNIAFTLDDIKNIDPIDISGSYGIYNKDNLYTIIGDPQTFFCYYGLRDEKIKTFLINTLPNIIKELSPQNRDTGYTPNEYENKMNDFDGTNACNSDFFSKSDLKKTNDEFMSRPQMGFDGGQVDPINKIDASFNYIKINLDTSGNDNFYNFLNAILIDESVYTNTKKMRDVIFCLVSNIKGENLGKLTYLLQIMYFMYLDDNNPVFKDNPNKKLYLHKYYKFLELIVYIIDNLLDKKYKNIKNPTDKKYYIKLYNIANEIRINMKQINFKNNSYATGSTEGFMSLDNYFNEITEKYKNVETNKKYFWIILLILIVVLLVKYRVFNKINIFI